MEKFIQLIENEVKKAFADCGYDEKFAKVSVSNRPDLCEYQCNGAMPLAKINKCAPIEIANRISEKLSSSDVFSMAEAVMPGFINMDLSDGFVSDYADLLSSDENLGCKKITDPHTIIIDYGGPNVAKPLHVGHLRSAIIGESVKRLLKFAGHTVYGDIHLGDWGLQMGLIITELKLRKPDLLYFDEKFDGEYPKEAPFTLSELEEIYPTASAKSKEDEKYKAEALAATNELQKGRPGYRAILSHILELSIADLKRNYSRLNVSFELWKGESDAQAYIPDMVAMMKEKGYAYESDGAYVVDVSDEKDSKEIPPCIITKSDGSSLYSTTDLATLVWRMKDYTPDDVIYVVDKRQQLHFTQVFRCAKKTGIVPENVNLRFLGFGTMNGKDKKPFKTREGGVMRLETLLDDTMDHMREKIVEGGKVTEADIDATTSKIALAAIKYGDLSNQPSKDYIFDMERFTSFEGNTGPYILYTIVRIKSILNKFSETGESASEAKILAPQKANEKSLMMELARFSDAIDASVAELSPNKLCAYIYGLCDTFNSFYHDTKILSEEDIARKHSYIKLLGLTGRVLETSIDILGFEAPDAM